MREGDGHGSRSQQRSGNFPLQGTGAAAHSPAGRPEGVPRCISCACNSPAIIATHDAQTWRRAACRWEPEPERMSLRVSVPHSKAARSTL